MTNLPTEIQKKLNEIQQCEVRAAQLRHEIKSWYDEVRAAVVHLGLDDSITAPSQPESQATPKHTSGGRPPKGSKPQIEFVVDVVNSDPTREWSIKEVYGRLIEQGEEINKPTVGSSLANARSEGMIVQGSKRGPYRAKASAGASRLEAATTTVQTVS